MYASRNIHHKNYNVGITIGSIDSFLFHFVLYNPVILQSALSLRFGVGHMR